MIPNLLLPQYTPLGCILRKSYRTSILFLSVSVLQVNFITDRGWQGNQALLTCSYTESATAVCTTPFLCTIYTGFFTIQHDNLQYRQTLGNKAWKNLPWRNHPVSYRPFCQCRDLPQDTSSLGRYWHIFHIWSYGMLKKFSRKHLPAGQVFSPSLLWYGRPLLKAETEGFIQT